MNRERILTLTALVLTLTLFAFFIIRMPTLDFDEALYRSVAQRMKASHSLWVLSWDGRDLFHKPPVFYWLVWFFSWVFDGAGALVSTLAARIPSFLSTLGILAYLFFSGRRFETSQNKSIGKNAVLTFLCGFFPLVTATSVLFDPLQTLCLMPALVVPTLYFYRGSLKKWDWILWSLSLFAASATKGLNGIIVPTIAFGIHASYGIKLYGFKVTRDLILKFIGVVFLPAVLLTFIYYFWLNGTLGTAFTHEFIWVQHFERGTSPMEQHSGSFFYHFFVVFFGGGILIPLLVDRSQSTRVPFAKLGFPLTYALSFMVIFGLSATKLPHYSWPVWPALALYIGLISSLPKDTLDARSQRKQWITYVPMLVLGLFSLGLALAPLAMLELFSHSESFQGVMKYFSGFNSFETACFFVAALACLVFEMFMEQCLQSLATCAVISTFVALGLSVGLTRTIESLMVTPFYDMAQVLKKEGAKTEDCIRYSGALSPTFSLALAPELIHNRCEPEAMKYLVSPEWKAKECANRGFKIIEQKAYLVLCKKG